MAMRIPSRELKPFAEPVKSGELDEGEVYFSVTFHDEDMLLPEMVPFVFIGRDLEPGDSRIAYFQDMDSYLRGVSYSTQGGSAEFLCGSEDELNQFFLFESALDVLLSCSVRRKSKGSPEE